MNTYVVYVVCQCVSVMLACVLYVNHLETGICFAYIQDIGTGEFADALSKTAVQSPLYNGFCSSLPVARARGLTESESFVAASAGGSALLAKVAIVCKSCELATMRSPHTLSSCASPAHLRSSTAAAGRSVAPDALCPSARAHASCL